MLKQRIITASILLPIILLALFLQPLWLWRILVSVFIGVAWWEWVRLSKAVDKTAFIVFATAALLGLIYVFSGVGFSLGVVVFSMILWSLAIVFCYLKTEKMSQLILPQTKLLFGAWVLAFSWWSLIWLREQANGPYWVLGFLAIIWLADTGAYFAGKRFGRTKLAPSISPGKTVEGLVGGALCVALYAAIVPGFFVENSRILLAIIAVVIAIISVGGDLFESWLKRYAQMKDSSQVLPGHGGVLDRIDSLIAAMPFIVAAYCYMTNMQIS